MTTKLSRDDFIQSLTDSGLFSLGEVIGVVEAIPEDQAPDGEALARLLVTQGKLTKFQLAAVWQRKFGDLAIGNYQVLDRLGAGGMGTVFKARHRRMKRTVAIKVLSAAVAQSEKFVQRFQREVEAVARLSHPNIVMAFDADEAEAGHFLVMEFVDGRDLASEVQSRGPLPVGEAVDCVVQAARALDYAHGKGIIHRDIKPANLLRDVSGVVKVADLGLARFNDQARSADDASSLTQAGSIMGTVDYMGPEQALGLTTIDHRADIYSLGCTLHFLLTGKPPYQGPSLMAIMLLHREGPVPPLRAVPAALEAAFRKMLAKKPEDRFAAMADVIAALEPFASGPPAVTPRNAPSTYQGTSSSTTFARSEQNPDTAVAAPPLASGQTVDLAPAAAASGAILLVEPSRSQAVVIRKYLTELGHQEVVTAPSGQKALELATASPPRVVISAMHLADMTGAQLVQAMRAEASLSAVGFVLVTSQADAHQANLQSLADHTVRLHKPFDLGQLAQAVALATGDSPSAVRAATTGPAAGLRILLVDDSAAARANARTVLAGLGATQITEVADGADAVPLLESEAFDLVVSDYNMPKLDGRGLLEHIRTKSRCRTIPVVLVTTEKDQSKLDAVRKLGVSAICEKSFKPDVVRGILERLR